MRHDATVDLVPLDTMQSESSIRVLAAVACLDTAEVVEERGLARLRLTSAGRVAFVNIGQFQSRAGDRVVYVDLDVVEFVVPRGAATLRLLLWGGFWRDEIPSMEESFLRDDAAKLPIDA